MWTRLSLACRLVSIRINNLLSKDFCRVLSLLDAHNLAPRHPDGFLISDTILLLFSMARIPYHLLKTLARLEDVLPEEVKELLAASGPVGKMEAQVDEVLGLLSTRLAPWVKVLKVKS